jgi:excisionase family DNA binding protein
MFKNYPDVVKTYEASQMIGIGKNSIYRLVKEGELEAIKVGRTNYITKKSIEDFVLRNFELFKLVPKENFERQRKSKKKVQEEMKFKDVKLMEVKKGESKTL